MHIITQCHLLTKCKEKRYSNVIITNIAQVYHETDDSYHVCQCNDIKHIV